MPFMPPTLPVASLLPTSSVKKVTDASTSMQRTIRILRSAIRTYSRTRQASDLKTLKKALESSGEELKISARNRRKSKRSSEVFKATFNMTMGEIGRNGDNDDIGAPQDDYIDSDSDSDEDERTAEDDIPDFLKSSDEEEESDEEVRRRGGAHRHIPPPRPPISPILPTDSTQ